MLLNYQELTQVVQIKSFTVKNFRSITEANELPLHNFSIIIGPNNEGKSNILRALVISQKFTSSFWLLTDIRLLRRRKMRKYRGKQPDDNDVEYNWERDFPISLQNKEPNGITTLTTKYLLTEAEKNQLQKLLKKPIKEYLSLTFKLGRDDYSIEINGMQFSEEKFYDVDMIFSIISSKIQVQYISAIRTSTQTIKTIEHMIAGQLSILQRTRKYQKALNNLEKLQTPILEELSGKLTTSVSDFLPQVKKIKINSRERIERIIREATTVSVNDGVNTLLELKGDGIKSLIAISIIQHVAKQRATKKNMVLVIEEPESHLHPNAIHKLNNVLKEISNKNQVIISTHSPLLVNRTDVSRNILVNKSKAIEGKNISTIRDMLGVKIADNLQSANLIVLVEGKKDIQILSVILKKLSPKIKKALEQGIISFDALDGGNNLAYKISIWKNLLCDVYVFLDHDKTGLKVFDEAKKQGIIQIKDVTFAKMRGFPESEIEDLIKMDIYEEEFKKIYGIELKKSSKLRTSKRKWSERMKIIFSENHKPWNERIKMEVKEMVANSVKDRSTKAIRTIPSSPFDTLVAALEDYLRVNQNRL